MMEFEINGKQYIAGKIPAMKQFHIIRRMAPVMSAGLPKGVGKESLQVVLKESAADVLTRFTTALSKMSDEDAEFVLIGLMSCVKLKMPGGTGYAAIVTGNTLQYDDIGLAEQLQIALKAGKHNLQDFLKALPQASPSAVQSVNAQ